MAAPAKLFDMLAVIDRSFEPPAGNLAHDDTLLAAESEILRLWESPSYFVALGRSGKAGEEVRPEAAVPILRRSSGGGTVLQGPGCFNFSLILSLHRRPELLNVSASYCVLLKAVAAALGVPGSTVAGSDILIDGRKVSGNAQRRTRGWLLHHGTLLYAMDLPLIERLLPEPSRQPAHRNGRLHRDFLANLPLSAPEIRHRLTTRLDAHLTTTARRAILA